MDFIRSVRLLLFPLPLVPVILSAQVTLRGSVSDSVTHETLVGANVYIPGTALVRDHGVRRRRVEPLLFRHRSADMDT